MATLLPQLSLFNRTAVFNLLAASALAEDIASLLVYLLCAGLASQNECAQPDKTGPDVL